MNCENPTRNETEDTFCLTCLETLPSLSSSSSLSLSATSARSFTSSMTRSQDRWDSSVLFCPLYLLTKKRSFEDITNREKLLTSPWTSKIETEEETQNVESENEAMFSQMRTHKRISDSPVTESKSSLPSLTSTQTTTMGGQVGLLWNHPENKSMGPTFPTLQNRKFRFPPAKNPTSTTIDTVQPRIIGTTSFSNPPISCDDGTKDPSSTVEQQIFGNYNEFLSSTHSARTTAGRATLTHTGLSTATNARKEPTYITTPTIITHTNPSTRKHQSELHISQETKDVSDFLAYTWKSLSLGKRLGTPALNSYLRKRQQQGDWNLTWMSSKKKNRFLLNSNPVPTFQYVPLQILQCVSTIRPTTYVPPVISSSSSSFVQEKSSRVSIDKSMDGNGSVIPFESKKKKHSMRHTRLLFPDHPSTKQIGLSVFNESVQDILQDIVWNQDSIHTTSRTDSTTTNPKKRKGKKKKKKTQKTSDESISQDEVDRSKKETTIPIPNPTPKLTIPLHLLHNLYQSMLEQDVDEEVPFFRRETMLMSSWEILDTMQMYEKNAYQLQLVQKHVLEKGKNFNQIRTGTNHVWNETIHTMGFSPM